MLLGVLAGFVLSPPYLLQQLLFLQCEHGALMNAADFEKFREMLLTLRSRLRGDFNMMSEEALGGMDGEFSDNRAPLHPADVGSHSFEQEFTLNLLSADGNRLDRIAVALVKISAGTYGTCDECGGRIPKARLEVIPDTAYCVKCASKLES